MMHENEVNSPANEQKKNCGGWKKWEIFKGIKTLILEFSSNGIRTMLATEQTIHKNGE